MLWNWLSFEQRLAFRNSYIDRNAMNTFFPTYTWEITEQIHSGRCPSFKCEYRKKNLKTFVTKLHDYVQQVC